MARQFMRLISQHTVISILVRDQDKALYFYTEILGLETRLDITFGPGLRLLTVASCGQQKPELALATPDITVYGEERVNELTSRVRRSISSIFMTSDCQSAYADLQARGVVFISAPTVHRYGVEAIFTDLDGNRFALLEAVPEALTLLKSLRIDTAA
jgi:catechol 2,3-dioxygenase-like lactoylglutathione lyase family enzyme